MSLDVWFQEDIQNTLLALNQTSMDTVARLAAVGADLHAAQAYRAGDGAQRSAVAIAFGISSTVPFVLRQTGGRTVTALQTQPEPLTENLRLLRNWTEVKYDDDMSGA